MKRISWGCFFIVLIGTGCIGMGHDSAWVARTNQMGRLIALFRDELTYKEKLLLMNTVTFEKLRRSGEFMIRYSDSAGPFKCTTYAANVPLERSIKAATRGAPIKMPVRYRQVKNIGRKEVEETGTSNIGLLASMVSVQPGDLLLIERLGY